MRSAHDLAGDPAASNAVYARLRAALAGEATPYGWVDLAAFDHNVTATLARCGAHRLRPASKSLRCVPALRRVLAASPRVAGVLCFTPREAAHLHAEGIDDLLVAYPSVEPRDLAAAAGRVAEHDARITLMVDDPDQVDRAARAARAHGTQLALCLDVDVSLDLPGLRFGVFRSPVRDAAAARSLAEHVARTPGVRLEGVMGYEAQIAGVPDAGLHLRRLAVRALKARSTALVRERRGTVVAAVEEVVGPLRFVNGGGTGSLETTTADPAVTEVSAGSAFFAPALFDDYRAFTLHPAAGFACAVTRRPSDTVVTVLGGGWVASGAAGADRLPHPFLPHGAELITNEGAGEVQTPVALGARAREVELGDPVFFRHAKAGELCERTDVLAVVDDDRVVAHWPTYRGAGLTLL